MITHVNWLVNSIHDSFHSYSSVLLVRMSCDNSRRVRISIIRDFSVAVFGGNSQQLLPARRKDKSRELSINYFLYYIIVLYV